jgi:hypothetical protein
VKLSDWAIAGHHVAGLQRDVLPRVADDVCSGIE